MARPADPPSDARGVRPRVDVVDAIRSAVVWTAIAGVAAAALPPMVLGYPLVLVDPKRALSDAYLRALGRTVIRLHPGWHVAVEGAERLRSGGPYVLVANHQSFADLIVMCFLGHPTKYLGKASVFRVPVLGWALRVAGEVPVVRGDRESGTRALRALERWLDRGVSVCLFPEGTRGDGDALAPFKPGAFKLAIDSGRPIMPVVISGAREILAKRSLVFNRRADVRVRVLSPVATRGMTGADVAPLAARVRAEMLAAFTELERERARDDRPSR